MHTQTLTGFTPLDGETALDFTARVQRERLMDGMVHAVARRGFPKATITDIVSPVGLGRNTFYRHFEDKRDCFLATGDRWFGRVEDAISDACADAPTSERVPRATAALLRTVAADGDSASAWLVGALGAGPAACEHRDAGMRRLANRLAGDDGSLSAAASVATVGAICTVITVELTERGGSRLDALHDDVVWLASLAAAGLPV